VSQGRWQDEVSELAEARSRGEIDDDRWFASMAGIFETAYLSGDNPRAQSGFGGDEVRWHAGRRPIAEAIDRDGTFLDIGCASGYLLESIVRWAPHRVEPYGLELTPALAELARRRLPEWADRIFIGNALTWRPPLRFDFVRTELVYVPAGRRLALVRHLLDDVVAPGGRLILCGYGSPRSAVLADPVNAFSLSYGLQPELALDVVAPEGGGAILELAVLRAGRSTKRRASWR
jgi:SAM-dependent methyltransferase